MAETVGQHQIALYTTPQNDDDGDADVVRGHFNTTRNDHNAHDEDPGIHVQSSTLAARPAFGEEGRKWITVDSGTLTLWYDTGAAWIRDTSFSVANGQPALHDAGNSGSAIEIDWADGPVQKLTLTAACTVTFTGATAGGTYTLLLVQNGTGGWAVTLTGWDFGDNTPTLNTTALSKTLVSALYDGAEYVAALGNTGA